MNYGDITGENPDTVGKGSPSVQKDLTTKWLPTLKSFRKGLLYVTLSDRFPLWSKYEPFKQRASLILVIQVFHVLFATQSEPLSP